MLQKNTTTVAASTYDKFPVVDVPHSEGECSVGWPALSRRLSAAVHGQQARKTILCVDCYPGVDTQAVTRMLAEHLSPTRVLAADTCLWDAGRVDRLVAPFLRENDPVFGKITSLELPDFFDPGRVAAMRSEIAAVESGTILLVGFGASHIAEEIAGTGMVTVYADLARWEIRQRFRRNQAGNIGADNRELPEAAKYRRAFFVDWQVADRWKRETVDRWDFVLDTNDPRQPKLAPVAVVRRGLHQAASQPFRIVPFFDPAPWGGQWMRQVCGLDESAPNFGWCFDCVPEENSLLLGIGGVVFEVPSIDLVFDQPQRLLGGHIVRNFGAEFPIRFDLLDTVGGGNLSFQVHPMAEYIREHFGMGYTQEESYYILDAEPGATVCLGLREDADRAAMENDLRRAQNGDIAFDAAHYVNVFPAVKHDHFLIPPGTCHCQGRNAMVLEISATPNIFTFKMWDWGRPGLDGRPRPIHLEDGLRNLQWDRRTRWVEENLVNCVVPLGEGDGWREEQTGLHELEFIETRRHWFTGIVSHDTNGTLHVLNLVEGKQAIVESPDGAFEPFVVHYAETFIIPAAVGKYTIRPHGPAEGTVCGTIKAFVRDSCAAGEPCNE